MLCVSLQFCYVILLVRCHWITIEPSLILQTRRMMSISNTWVCCVGMRLELAGVTLDSSTDDLNSVATTCGRRNAHRHRNDLSMDSGIQGSSFDLAAASSSSDLEENMDDDSLNRFQTHDHTRIARETAIWRNPPIHNFTGDRINLAVPE